MAFAGLTNTLHFKNLDEYIEYKRNFFDQEELKIKDYEEKIKLLKKQKDELHGSLNQRRKQFLQKQISKLEKELLIIQQGNNRKKFEEEIEPYYEMYKWHVQNMKNETGAMFSKPKKHLISNEKKNQKKVKRKKKQVVTVDWNGIFEDDDSSCLSQDSTQKSILESESVCVEKPNTETNHEQEAELILFQCLFKFEKINPVIYLRSADVCAACGVRMVLSIDGSKITCPECHYSYEHIEATMASTSFNDSVEVSNFFYQKMTHLNDVLKWYSDRDSSEISEEIVEQIMNYWYVRFEAQGIHKESQFEYIFKNITIPMVSEAITGLGLNKKLNPIQIQSIITGVEAPKISLQQEETFRFMFQACEKPFKKHAPPERDNFLSYYYCLYKFSQILGWNHLLELFPLVKGRNVLNIHEEVFKNICKDLKWTFIPVRNEHKPNMMMDPQKLVQYAKTISIDLLVQ